MGVDSVFYAVGPEVAYETLRRLVWRACSDHHDKFALRLSEDGHKDGRYVFHSIFRYYGPGYARGHWPDVYSIIRLLQNELPEHVIKYGGDSDDDGELCTREFLDDRWKFWTSESHASYANDFHPSRPKCCGGPMRAGWRSGAWQQYECCVCERKIQVGNDGVEQPFEEVKI